MLFYLLSFTQYLPYSNTCSSMKVLRYYLSWLPWRYSLHRRYFEKVKVVLQFASLISMLWQVRSWPATVYQPFQFLIAQDYKLQDQVLYINAFFVYLVPGNIFMYFYKYGDSIQNRVPLSQTHQQQEMVSGWYPVIYTCAPISMDTVYRTGYHFHISSQKCILYLFVSGF